MAKSLLFGDGHPPRSRVWETMLNKRWFLQYRRAEAEGRAEEAQEEKEKEKEKEKKKDKIREPLTEVRE